MRFRISWLFCFQCTVIQVVRETTDQGKCVIHVTQTICVDEGLVSGERCSDADFLRSPVEIDPNGVRWKDHK